MRALPRVRWPALRAVERPFLIGFRLPFTRGGEQAPEVRRDRSTRDPLHLKGGSGETGRRVDTREGRGDKQHQHAAE